MSNNNNITTNLSQRPILIFGSISFIAGAIIMILSTMIHPSGEDPFNHPLVLAEYAHSELWVGIHIGQFVGTMMVFLGGFVTIYRLLTNSESSITSLLGLIGFAFAIVTASTFAILQAVDGVALKFAVDSWMASSGQEEKDTIFRVAEGIRWTEYGVNSVFRLLQGTVAIIFGLAIAKSIIVNRWIGVGGVIIGLITLMAGVEVSYSAFAYPNFEGIRGISMIIFLAWIILLGAAMLKKTSAKRI
ncbi:MAG TPA: hypothetical protein VLE21_02575 [Candidatus Nitrosocosmicus sp.]|nr:hypothetical protein [Candidatus Nitrosocosmicus sp.]